MMTNEVRKAKIDWMNQMSKVLNAILKDTEPTEWATKAEPTQEGFEDSCKFIDLRYQISELSQTLKNMAKYSNLIQD